MRAILLSAGIGYLLGSIPFGYLLVKIFRGSDVRATGSGNIGATNVARTSPLLGVATLILDAAKGFAAVLLISVMLPGNGTVKACAALAAICGHIFPCWLRFRGGKGVATGLGSLVLVAPKAVLFALGVFAVILGALRFVSLASILSAASLAVFVLFAGTWSRAEAALITVGCILVIMKHRQNIRRLLAGTEPRIGAPKQ